MYRNQFSRKRCSGHKIYKLVNIVHFLGVSKSNKEFPRSLQVLYKDRNLVHIRKLLEMNYFLATNLLVLALGNLHRSIQHKEHSL